MNVEAFASHRRELFVEVDDVMMPAVRTALGQFGQPGAWDAVIDQATNVWLSILTDEAPGAFPDRIVRDFRSDLRDSLEKTAAPSQPIKDSEVERVAMWIGTYTVNSATWYAGRAEGDRTKTWMTMHDGLVRPIHHAADGQVRLIGGTFDVGGHKLRFPGEPVGPPEVWINCRCILRPGGARAMTAAAQSEIDEDLELTYVVDEDLPEDEATEVSEELIDGEDLVDDITEIPVHGVLAPEGVATGDGRMFAHGSLTHRDLPLPIRDEIVGTHGGDTSEVVTVGRIDEIFRHGDEMRFRGVVIMSKEHAPQLIGGIIDGTKRGISVEVDDVTLDVTEEREAMKARIIADQGGGDVAEGEVAEPRAVMSDEEIEALLDQFVGDGTTPLTVFSEARIDGFTVVPIPAYPEAYIALGWDFEDEVEVTDEELAALQACGCFDSVGGDDEEDNPDIELGYDAFSAIDVAQEALTAYGLDSPQRSVASNAQQTANFAGRVIVINLERSPGSARPGVGPSLGWDFSADRATASLLLKHGVELGLADPVLSVEDAVSASHPSFIRYLDALGVDSGSFDQACAAFSSPSVATPVEISVRPRSSAHSTSDRAYVVDRHSVDLSGRGGRATPIQVVVALTEAARPNSVSAIGNDAGAHAGNLTLFRQYTAEERRKLMEEGKAMEPDGSFPIADVEDLKNAIQAIGRAGDREAAIAHIKKRANALGESDLIPEDWSAIVAASFAPGTKDGPGWITHPRATARIRRYWVRGKGAGKIKWGVPGDFNRCRAQLAKYVRNPDWLAGLCANMHKEALGIWPAQHHSASGLVASGAAPALTLVASASKQYPSEWFAEPQMDKMIGMRIEGERIFGYLAEWGVCHIGIPGVCTTAPHSLTNYSTFLKGVVDTEKGEQRVGTLTTGVGHAKLQMRAAAATAHYDKTDAARAFVNVGENSRGIWYAGVLAPNITEEQKDELRAIGAFSGDWRDVRGNLDLVAAVCVTAGGFPGRPALAASGGHQTALVAAGMLRPESIVATGALRADEVAAIARASVAEFINESERRALIEKTRDARASMKSKRLAELRAKVAKES